MLRPRNNLETRKAKCEPKSSDSKQDEGIMTVRRQVTCSGQTFFFTFQQKTINLQVTRFRLQNRDGICWTDKKNYGLMDLEHMGLMLTQVKITCVHWLPNHIDSQQFYAYSKPEIKLPRPSSRWGWCEWHSTQWGLVQERALMDNKWTSNAVHRTSFGPKSIQMVSINQIQSLMHERYNWLATTKEPGIREV